MAGATTNGESGKIKMASVMDEFDTSDLTGSNTVPTEKNDEESLGIGVLLACIASYIVFLVIVMALHRCLCVRLCPIQSCIECKVCLQDRCNCQMYTTHFKNFCFDTFSGIGRINCRHNTHKSEHDYCPWVCECYDPSFYVDCCCFHISTRLPTSKEGPSLYKLEQPSMILGSSHGEWI